MLEKTVLMPRHPYHPSLGSTTALAKHTTTCDAHYYFRRVKSKQAERKHWGECGTANALDRQQQVAGWRAGSTMAVKKKSNQEKTQHCVHVHSALHALSIQQQGRASRSLALHAWLLQGPSRHHFLRGTGSESASRS